MSNKGYYVVHISDYYVLENILEYPGDVFANWFTFLYQHILNEKSHYYGAPSATASNSDYAALGYFTVSYQKRNVLGIPTWAQYDYIIFLPVNTIAVM